eukprot:scaffold149150_cov15-Tisochrysis_lutea.AAC.1
MHNGEHDGHPSKGSVLSGILNQDVAHFYSMASACKPDEAGHSNLPLLATHVPATVAASGALALLNLIMTSLHTIYMIAKKYAVLFCVLARLGLSGKLLFTRRCYTTASEPSNT